MIRRLFRRKGAAKLPDHVTIGRHSYGLSRRNLVRPSAAAPVAIGSFCSIGPEVLIFGQADHPTHLASTYPFRTLLFDPAAGNRDATTRGGVTIGNDVWIGARAMVLSGVSIGHGAVVGAGAVVARDVPPYAIVVGNPARVARHRFPPEIVERLLALAWWDWPDERLRALEDVLYGPVEAFLERCGG